MGTTCRSQSGFSIVELMVAAVIGLIGSVVIFQVFSVFEGQKRTTATGGDAQANLAIAMHRIETDARQAGFGINDPAFFGCAVSGGEEDPLGSGSGTSFTLTLVPVNIVQGSSTVDSVSGGALKADTLTFMYGSSDLAHFPPKLIQNLASPASNYRVSNRHGFQVGDVMVLAELRGTPLAPVCAMSQARSLPAIVGNLDVIDHSNGSYDQGGITLNTRFSYAGLGPNYTAETTRVFNLGRAPVVNTYSVNNGRLMLQSFRGAAQPVMDGVVQMQVRYGKDTGTDNIVDVYDDITPTTPANWAKVLTIRVALAARVGQYEKTEVSPATILLWGGGPVWTLTSEERHYRYHVIDTIIPLRNIIWRRAAS